MAEQKHFFDPLADEGAHFGHDFAHGAAPFTAALLRNDAEGAGVRTTIHDGHGSGNGGLFTHQIGRKHHLPILPCVALGGGRFLHRLRLLLGQMGDQRLAISGGFHEHIHKGKFFLERLVAAHADNAPHDGDGLIGELLFEGAQGV